MQSAIGAPFIALGIALAFGGLAAAAHFGIRLAIRSQRLREEGRGATLEVRVIEALRKPLVAALVLVGVLAALTWLNETTHPFPVDTRQGAQWLRQAWMVVIIGVVCYALTRLARAFLGWRLVARYADASPAMRAIVLPILNRTAGIAVFTMGGLIALNILGIPITPLLAGIGIGGLAVALALSPTLSSYIAGTFVVAEGQIREGDYIELDPERAGFVENVGWRSTVLRSRFNNMIIVPNSVITDSVVTNYDTPNTFVTGIVANGVSYASDLGRVEEVALATARDVIDSSDDANKEFEPVLRYFDFGDSNVGFNLIFQARDRAGMFAARHEIIKGIHARFKEEGIEINYPVRKLEAPSELGYLTVGRGRRGLRRRFR